MIGWRVTGDETLALCGKDNLVARNVVLLNVCIKRASATTCKSNSNTNLGVILCIPSVQCNGREVETAIEVDSLKRL